MIVELSSRPCTRVVLGLGKHSENEEIPRRKEKGSAKSSIICPFSVMYKLYHVRWPNHLQQPLQLLRIDVINVESARNHLSTTLFYGRILIIATLIFPNRCPHRPLGGFLFSFRKFANCRDKFVTGLQSPLLFFVNGMRMGRSLMVHKNEQPTKKEQHGGEINV